MLFPPFSSQALLRKSLLGAVSERGVDKPPHLLGRPHPALFLFRRIGFFKLFLFFS